MFLTRSPRRLLWSIPILALAVCGAAAISPDGQARSVWIGVYSGAQARNGEALYLEHCAQCHGANLAGVEQAPALAGGAFGEKWKGATLKTLFDRVASMPPTRPNSLSAPQYADVLAYLLSAAGLPSGTTMLPADRSALDELVFSPTRTSTQMTESAPAPAPVRTAPSGTPDDAAPPPVEWRTYGGNLASMRYSPLDQIDRNNFSRLQIAWRLSTDFLGPRPDNLYARRRSWSAECCTPRPAPGAPWWRSGPPRAR